MLTAADLAVIVDTLNTSLSIGGAGFGFTVKARNNVMVKTVKLLEGTNINVKKK